MSKFFRKFVFCGCSRSHSDNRSNNANDSTLDDVSKLVPSSSSDNCAEESNDNLARHFDLSSIKFIDDEDPDDESFFIKNGTKLDFCRFFFCFFFFFIPIWSEHFSIFIRNFLMGELLLSNERSTQPPKSASIVRRGINRHRSDRCFRFVDRVTINSSSSLAPPMPTIFLLSSDALEVRIIYQSNHLNSLIYIYLNFIEMNIVY